MKRTRDQIWESCKELMIKPVPYRDGGVPIDQWRHAEAVLGRGLSFAVEEEIVLQSLLTNAIDRRERADENLAKVKEIMSSRSRVSNACWMGLCRRRSYCLKETMEASKQERFYWDRILALQSGIARVREIAGRSSTPSTSSSPKTAAVPGKCACPVPDFDVIV